MGHVATMRAWRFRSAPTRIVSLTPAAAGKIRALMETETRRLRAARRDRGRRLLGLPVRPRLRPRRPGGRPRVRVRGRQGRRRPVQRSVPQGRDRRLPRDDRRSPGSRSTTRTPSPRAAAATRSRSPTARPPQTAPAAARLLALAPRCSHRRSPAAVPDEGLGPDAWHVSAGHVRSDAALRSARRLARAHPTPLGRVPRVRRRALARRDVSREESPIPAAAGAFTIRSDERERKRAAAARRRRRLRPRRVLRRRARSSPPRRPSRST